MKLKNNLTFKHMLDMLEAQYNHKYDRNQKYQLELGFERSVDISKYANPEFDWICMSHFRCALEHGSDISRYVKPTYVPQLLQVISNLAVFKVDIERFVSNNQLDIEGMLEAHTHHALSKGMKPLDGTLKEALYLLGPYYVND